MYVTPNHMGRGPKYTPEQKETVRRNIARFRKELGPTVTQQDVATMSGLSVFSISRYEGGGTVPDPPALLSLSKVFGRPVEDFFNPDPPEPDPSKRETFAVRWSIIGQAPDGLQEELEAVVRKYTVDKARVQVRTKQRLRKKQPKKMG